VDEWIEAEVEARMAGWILERRQEAAACQSPAPTLSESALPPSAAAQTLPAQVETGNHSKLASRMAADERGSTSAQRCLPKSCKGSQRKCSTRNAALPFEPAPAPSRAGSGPSGPPAPHKPETDPNTAAAVAALNLLEKAMGSGARALEHEMEESEGGCGPHFLVPAEQLWLSGFSAPGNRSLDSTPAPPQSVLSVRPNPGNHGQLSLHAPRIQGHVRPNQDEARRAPHSESCPGKKLRPPLRPFSVYRHRLAAAP
jgi:hypothetical protein